MTQRLTLDTQGIEQTLEEVAQLGMNVDSACAEALKVGGDELLKEMERLVPVGKAPEDPHPGNLKRNLVRTEPEQDGNYIFVLVGISPDADAETARYGNAQEYGTSIMPAHPYIRPASVNGYRNARIAMVEKLMILQKVGQR